MNEQSRWATATGAAIGLIVGLGGGYLLGSSRLAECADAIEGYDALYQLQADVVAASIDGDDAAVEATLGEIEEQARKVDALANQCAGT